MPEIDLKPDDYRVQTKRGTWTTRDDFRLAFPYIGLVGLAFIIFAWWNRAELPLIGLLATVGVACFFIGMIFGGWMKRFD